MSNQKEEKLHATNHYLYYPDEEDIPPYLAYGFRPIFLLLAPYFILSMALWGLVWSGYLSIPFIDNVLQWHIYEMLFGVLTAGVMAFLTTGLPELFPGMVPLVGKRLKYIMILWIAGRVSFWLIDITGVYLTAILNLAMLAWLIWFAKDVVLDKLQRHASLGYALVVIFAVEVWFFASVLGWSESNSMSILRVALGAIVVLILLAMRRVNMEAVNELMEDKEIDDIYISHPPLTNLAIFAVTLYTIVGYFYPTNSALGWIALASGASIVAITSDYNLKDKFILNQPYVIYLFWIFMLFGLGYGLIGWSILFDGANSVSGFRHFITAGGLGLAYLMVMITIGWIHTGRHLTSNIYTHFMVFFIVLATFMRGLIPFFEEYSTQLYLWSAIVWVLPFMLYIKVFFRFLLTPRVDGVKG